MSTVSDDKQAISDVWQTTIDDWIDGLYHRHRYAEHTLNAYRQDVMGFAVFMQSQFVKPPHTTTKQDISRYFATRQDDGLTVRSAKRQLSALKAFFEFVATQANITNPALSVKLKHKSEKLPTLLDVDVLFRLLDQPAPTDDKQALLWQRDKAMFELLYGSGLRVSELVGLDVFSVDLVGKQACVLGKGSKMRYVPMTARSVQAITDYLPIRTTWQNDKSGQALFLSKRGTRLTTRSVELRLELAVQSAGIDEHLHPHLLRHAFASHILGSSGDLRAVQELLGHANLTTTQIYTQLDFQKLSSLYDKAHPRA